MAERARRLAFVALLLAAAAATAQDNTITNVTFATDLDSGGAGRRV